MKKKLFSILVLMVSISLAAIRPTGAEIEYINWTNPTRRNYYDSYYGASVTAYDQKTTAILTVNIYNNRFSPHAYFTVKVKMDWAADNATTVEDYKIQYGQSHVFEVSISIPETASERYRHVYTIYPVYREAPGDDRKSDRSETYSDLVIYTPEQSEANSKKNELDAYPYWYYTPVLSSSKAREQMINASLNERMGDQSYATGDFAGALDYYKAALDSTNEAYASDTEYLSSFEVTLVQLIAAGTSYLTFQGWAFFVASLGFLLIGIGVIVYLMRRSKPPTS